MAKQKNRSKITDKPGLPVNTDISAADLAALYKEIKAQDENRRAQMAAQEEEYRAMGAELTERQDQLQQLQALRHDVLGEMVGKVDAAIEKAEASIAAQEEKMQRYLSKREWLAVKVQTEDTSDSDADADADDDEATAEDSDDEDEDDGEADLDTALASHERGQTHVAFTPLGGAQETGANSYLLEFRRTGKRVLIDAGIRYTADGDRLPTFDKLDKPDLVIITHAHLDHCAALPLLVKKWPDLPVWCSTLAEPLIRTSLEETAKIMGNDEIHDETELALYSLAEVDAVKLTGVPFGTAMTPFDGDKLSVTLYPAGHQLGAASIGFEGNGDSVFVTGDFTCHDEPTVAAAEWPDQQYDLLIMESTFGNRTAINRESMEQSFLKKVSEVIHRGGYVLIPAPAVGRAQDIYLLLRSAMMKHHSIPDFQIYLDGKVRSVCQVYNRRRKSMPASSNVKGSRDLFFSYPGISVTDDLRPRVWDKPCCIIASSASLAGGPSVYYAQKLVRRTDSAIILPTSPETSLGAESRLEALAGGKVACEVAHFPITGHPTQEELLSTVQQINPQGVLLVHGMPEATRTLSRAIPHGIKVKVPQNGERMVIRPSKA